MVEVKVCELRESSICKKLRIYLMAKESPPDIQCERQDCEIHNMSNIGRFFNNFNVSFLETN